MTTVIEREIDTRKPRLGIEQVSPEYTIPFSTIDGEGDAPTEGISAEMVEGLPVRLVELYARLAARHGVVREVDRGVWFASVAGFRGAWSHGDTPKQALDQLPDAIAGWVAGKRRVHAHNIPVIEGLDLNPRESE
jgi:predicted RNase H-like HicB family nuclease